MDTSDRRFIDKSRELASLFDFHIKEKIVATATHTEPEFKLESPVEDENEDPQKIYPSYNQKFVNLSCHSAHFDWLYLLKVLATYLGEPTTAEILKSVKKHEK